MSFVECPEVRVEVREGIGWIVIDRPARRNALTTTMYAAVRDAVRRFDQERGDGGAGAGVDVLVLTGTDRDFAVGGDLDESLAVARGGDPAARYAWVDALPYDTLRATRLTTIAAINGTCLGGALALAACCDLLVASDRARFGLPEARAGVYDPWGPELLAPRLSRTHLNHLVYTGELIGAAQAHAWGLLNDVVEHDGLDARVAQWVQRVRATDPDARAGYKQLITGRDVIPPATAAVVGGSGRQRGGAPGRGREETSR